MAEKSEDSLINWIRQRSDIGPDAAGVRLGIGDDMAIVTPTGDSLLVAADMLLDGVHFNSTIHTPEAIGRKALAVNLSDCAAMAVRPRWAVVSVALPASWTMEQAKRLHQGMADLAATYDCHIIGGDTNSWRPDPSNTNPPRDALVIDITILADPWPDIAPVRRDGMKPHDEIYVTGPLGGSLTGKHLTFEPRIRIAHWLARQLGDKLHAMMDLSDGLSTDGARMASASHRGMLLDETLLDAVASESARRLSTKDGRALTDHVLNDGEDFELLFTIAPNASSTLADAPTKLHRIGTAIPDPGLWLHHPDNTRTPIQPGGWQHFTA